VRENFFIFHNRSSAHKEAEAEEEEEVKHSGQECLLAIVKDKQHSTFASDS
jgi:hypothetical protein